MQIQNWTITDHNGAIWSARCHCGYTMSCAKALITSRPPKCKRCGASAAKAVDKPADKAATPPMADAFFKVFGMVPVDPQPRRAIVVPRVSPAEMRTEPVVHPTYGGRAQPIVPGEVYGRLTILREVEPTDRRMVEARCSCGEVKVYPWSALRMTNTRSCGCLRREVSAAIASRYVHIPVVALPGERFGKLVVVCDAPKTGRHRKVTATCDCGVTRDYDARTLVHGGARSCGCSRSVKVGQRKHAFPGMVYRYLTVVGDSADSKRGHRKVDCLCVCGKVTAVSVTDLVRLRIASCGCQRWLGAKVYHERALREVEP